MNNDLEKFSEERLIELANENIICKVSWDERVALGRIALSAKQAKPVLIFDKPDSLAYRSLIQTLEVGTKFYTTPQPAHTEQGGWIKCSERMPEPEIPVLIMNNGDMRIGEIRWDYPTHEETYQAFRYWDDPFDDGQIWDCCDITHWMPLPAAPKPESEE